MAGLRWLFISGWLWALSGLFPAVAAAAETGPVLVLGRISDDPKTHYEQLKPLLDYVVARMHGGGAVEALSAGSKPSGRINPNAIRFMAELGYDLTTHASKSLEEISGDFDAVVTMGCGDDCPWVPAKRREDWALPDPKDLDEDGYRAVRDEIARRVQALLASL